MFEFATNWLRRARVEAERLSLQEQAVAAERKALAKLAEAVDLTLTDYPGNQIWADEPGWHPLDPFGWGNRYMDRRQLGEQSPVYLTDVQLKIIRDKSRHLAVTNEFAINAMENRVNYIVGCGSVFRFEPRRKDDAAAAELCEAAKDFWDEFADRVGWPHLEQEAVMRADRDGEWFLRFFAAGARMDVRFIEPEFIRPKENNSRDTFGVVTADGDVADVKGYWVVAAPNEGQTPTEKVDAKDMLHFKLNVDSSAKRGIPTMYPVFGNLERAEKILRNLSILIAARATYAVIRKHAGRSSSAVDTFRQDEADYTYTAPSGAGNYLKRLLPGTIIDTSNQVEYEFPGLEADVGGMVATLQAELRAIASRLVMPEYMLSADACLDAASEILTVDGWRGPEGIGPDTLIATVNPETHALEYQKSTHQFRFQHDGPMVHVQSKAFDHMVTPNHDLFVGQRLWNGTAWRKMRADTVADRWRAFKLSSAVDWRGGETPERLDIPGLGAVDAAGFLRWLGVYIGDGSIAGKSTRVTIGSLSKPRKLKFYEPLCDALGFKRCDGSDGRTCWYVDNKELHDWIAENVGTNCADKRLPKFVGALSRESLRHLWAGLLASDGHTPKHGKGFTYSSCSRQLVDDIQIALLKAGLTASVTECPPGQLGTRPIYRLSVNEAKPHLLTRENISSPGYKGLVWCVSVPNGLVVARRNGKTIITGNSNANYSSTMIAESPACKQFERLQSLYAHAFGAGVHRAEGRLGVAWRVLRQGVAGGELPPDVLERVKIAVKGPSTVVRDRPAETTRFQALHAAGVLSKKTWAAEEGYDYDDETKNLQGEQIAGHDPAEFGLSAVPAGAPEEPPGEPPAAGGEESGA